MHMMLLEVWDRLAIPLITGISTLMEDRRAGGRMGMDPDPVNMVHPWSDTRIAMVWLVRTMEALHRVGGRCRGAL